MSAIRFGRGRDYQFFRQEDIRRSWDLRSAVQFLNGFRPDKVAMANFRRQVKEEITASPANLSDEQVIQSLARLMVSGEFMVALPERLQHRDPIVLREAASAPSAPRESKPVEVVEDDPTFETNHDGVAQASVLIAAARAGLPFCEECAKLAAEQAPNKAAAKQTAGSPPANQTSNKPAAVQETAPPAAKQESPVPVAKPAPVAKEETPAPSAKQEAPPPVARQETPAPSAKEEAPAPAATQETSTPVANQMASAQAVKKETYWVEIALIGEDGQPIPGEEFVVELPDGRRETGVLDGNGLARFSELPTSGTCKVSFPQLDRDAWQLVPSNRN